MEKDSITYHLDRYFKTTPREQILEDWEKTREGNVFVDEFKKCEPVTQPPTLHYITIILFTLFLFFAAYLYYDYKVLQLQENVLLLQSEVYTNLPE